MNNAPQLIPAVAQDPATDSPDKAFAPDSIDSARRTAIKQVASLCGLTLSATSLSALAALVTPPTDMNRSSKSLLDKDQLALVRALGELIIPTTDTPGAIAAGVHDFINHFTAYCATKEEQQALLDFLKQVNTSSDKPFLLLSQAQQLELLTNMEQAKNGFTQEDRSRVKQFKALVLFGYYTSEIGATQELAYLAIPGGYKGNFKFKEIGKAWALPQ